MEHAVHVGRIANQTGTKLFRTADFSARNTLGAFKISNLAKLGKVIEVTLPIGPNSEDVYAIALDVVNFLAFVFFNNNLVGDAGCAHGGNSLFKRLLNIDLAALLVEVVRSNTNNQIIAQGLSAL